MSQKPVTDARILHEARKAGVEELYLEHLAYLKVSLQTAIQNGQGDLLAFLLAFSSLGNEIERRKKNNFRT